jgi:hypothetical protein
MSKSLNASILANFSINFTETEDNVTVGSDVINKQSISSYSYPTGVTIGSSEADLSVKQTGVLDSGSYVNIDLTSIEKDSFNVDGVADFSGVRFIGVINDSTASGYDISITATGSNPFTDLFNGGSGNLLIKPSSFFAYNDPYGSLRTSTSSKNIQINDVGGSGANYTAIILGDSF